MKSSNRTSHISRGTFLRTLALGAPLLPAASLTAQTNDPSPPERKIDLGNLRTFVELARSDIRTEKALLIAENIKFTADEAVEFWPVQREYETELNKILDERYNGILEYAKHYLAMTEEQATTLAMRSFDLQEKRTALKRKYFKKFSKVVPPVKAARFFQIENQINMALDLQVAASMPLIK